MPEAPPISVLDAFPILRDRIRVEPVMPGFSGASVWKIETSSNALFALKASPTGFSIERLRDQHRHQLRAAEALSFIPKFHRDGNRETAILNGGRCWELADWMPGDTGSSRADFELACTGLYRLHRVWADTAKRVSSCPSLDRRERLYRDWQTRIGLDPSRFEPRLGELLKRAEDRVERNFARAVAALNFSRNRSTRVQIVVGDPRREHIFFHNGEISGWIDFGASKLDSPESDLARLTVDWFGGDESKIALALRAYGDPRELDGELVYLLAQTGWLGSLANWQLRCSSERFETATQLRIADRLEWLLHSGNESLVIPAAFAV